MKGKNKVIVCVSNDLITDNRVEKTCSILQELDYKVLLIGRKKKNSPKMNARNYPTRRLNLLFEKGPFFYFVLNLRLFFYLLFRKTNLIYANDLDTLPACYMAFKLKRKTKIIYDTHELFTEVSELIDRPIKRKIWLKIEESIFPKLDTIITVNDSIAEVYYNKYKVPVHVVRNIPPKYEMQNANDREAMGIRENEFLLIIQGSGLNKDRGIEEVILAMKHCQDCRLLIVGDGDIIPDAKHLVKENQLSESVQFFSRRPYLELMKITEMADLGLLMDKAVNTNHELALPNKLFDYMHANTPVLSNQLKEIEKFIRFNNIGVVINEVNPMGIAKAIMDLKNDQTLLEVLKENCKKTSLKEHWGNEKIKLKKAISEQNPI